MLPAVIEAAPWNSFKRQVTDAEAWARALVQVSDPVSVLLENMMKD
jgi:hypothetical protein